jgi:hypothetical protein
MDSFYTCSLRIFLLELFCLLSLSGNISCKMCCLSPHGEASPLGLRTLRTDWTGSTDGKTKLNLDDFLIARLGGRPTAAGLTLRTLGLFVFPINREIG